ncbi:MAG: 2-oxo acid dehydrogenase subunit E2, partial [Chloroflexota bacterium]|nr:2-oxo acid dehydrogenase subunit E2 [Chloroflexota bacterium]
MSADEQTETERIERALEGVNAGYVAEMQERWQADPASVDPEWRALFEPAIGRPSENRSPTPPWADASPPASEVAPPAALPSGATLIRGPAASLARNMTASLAVPTATSFRDIEVAVLQARRRELVAQLAPLRVSLTHLIGWAIVRAAATQPGMTAYYLEADGAAYRVDPGGVHLGLAVDVERPDGGRFLVVPVIRSAEAMDFD